MGPLVVGITGHKRSGKDSLARGFVDQGWRRIGLADALKDMMVAINPWVSTNLDPDRGPHLRLQDLIATDGWEQAKTFPDVRRLLQIAGTEGVRDHIGDDSWIRALKKQIDESSTGVVVPDVRFSNEAQAIWSWGGLVVGVQRPGLPQTDTHSSETELASIVADITVTNDSTIDELQSHVPEIIEAIERKHHGVCQSPMPGNPHARCGLAFGHDNPANRSALTRPHRYVVKVPVGSGATPNG